MRVRRCVLMQDLPVVSERYISLPEIGGYRYPKYLMFFAATTSGSDSGSGSRGSEIIILQEKKSSHKFPPSSRPAGPVFSTEMDST